jgi:hypothetical protein
MSKTLGKAGAQWPPCGEKRLLALTVQNANLQLIRPLCCGVVEESAVGVKGEGHRGMLARRAAHKELSEGDVIQRIGLTLRIDIGHHPRMVGMERITGRWTPSVSNITVPCFTRNQLGKVSLRNLRPRRRAGGQRQQEETAERADDHQRMLHKESPFDV